MVVQHNLQAMNANRMLNVTTGNQSKSTEKLSSGYKINRAADDAAGLSISEKMRKQIRGLDQASSNAQDGVSAVQTAEGALTEVHSMLQRMNELAVQASNGTNSKSDRDSIQDEIQQLTKEIDRVAETTKFNEIFLLKGDVNGNTRTEILSAHDAGLRGKLTGVGTGSAIFTMDALDLGDSITIAGNNYTIGDKAENIAKAILDEAKTKCQGGGTYSFSVNNNSYTVNVKNDNTIEKITDENDQIAYLDAGQLKWGSAGDASTKEVKTAADLAKLFTAGNTIAFGDKKVAVMKDADADAAAGISTIDTSVITKEKAYALIQNELGVASSIGTDTPATVGAATVAGKKVTYAITEGTVTVADKLAFNLHVGSDAAMSNKISVDIETMSAANLGIKGLNVSDETGTAATYAIDSIADAIAKVSSQRSSLGAIQNRLEHSIANLDNVVENTTSAESRIRDTDMAEEMVEYSKNNILAQAGQSMLAQANQSTQGVMSLLQ